MTQSKIDSLKEYMLLHFQVTPENIDEKLQELKDKVNNKEFKTRVMGEWKVNEEGI